MVLPGELTPEMEAALVECLRILARRGRAIEEGEREKGEGTRQKAEAEGTKEKGVMNSRKEKHSDGE